MQVVDAADRELTIQRPEPGIDVRVLHDERYRDQKAEHECHVLRHTHDDEWGIADHHIDGLLLTVWDRLLGTFAAKPSRPITSKDMGVDELPNFPKSFIEQMILPFVYKPGTGEPERYKVPAQTPAQEARVQTTLHAAE